MNHRSRVRQIAGSRTNSIFRGPIFVNQANSGQIPEMASDQLQGDVLAGQGDGTHAGDSAKLLDQDPVVAGRCEKTSHSFRLNYVSEILNIEAKFFFGYDEPATGGQGAKDVYDRTVEGIGWHLQVYIPLVHPIVAVPP